MFNVPEIVKKVAEEVIRKVDASSENFADTDFTDLGAQDQLVQMELQDVYDHLPSNIYDKLVENVLEHPEMQLCFETAKVIVDDWKSSVIQEEIELEIMTRDYYREVL